MGVGSRQRNVVLAIACIVAAQCCESLQNSMPNGSVTRKGVENQIDQSIVRLVGVCKDEGASVDSLSQTRSQLIKAGIAVEVNFDHWADAMLTTAG